MVPAQSTVREHARPEGVSGAGGVTAVEVGSAADVVGSSSSVDVVDGAGGSAVVVASDVEVDCSAEVEGPGLGPRVAFIRGARPLAHTLVISQYV